MAKQGTSDRWMWAVVLGATAAVVALAIIQGGRAEKSAQAASELVSKAAITLSLPLLDGRGKAGIVPGKITVVDFWATWCAPCRASMPRVQKVYDDYRARGVELYSVDTVEGSAADRESMVREFLLKNRLTFPVVLDDDSASVAFSVESLPTMVVLDRSGRVLWRHIGELDASEERSLRGVLDKALSATAQD